MSTKHMISPGIGFSPGSVRFIVTRGLLGIVAIHPQIDFDLVITRASVLDLAINQASMLDLGINRSTALNLEINQSTAFDLGIQRVVTFDAEVG